MFKMNKYECSKCEGIKVTNSSEPTLQMKCCDGDNPVEHKLTDKNKEPKNIPVKEEKAEEVLVQVNKPSAAPAVVKPNVSRSTISTRPLTVKK